MSVNEQMYKYGSARSAIRELFTYGCEKKAEGKEIYDFSLGNPATPTPNAITKQIIYEAENTPSLFVHGYTAAQGTADTRKAIADTMDGMIPDRIFITCGAAASLCITIRALMTDDGDEVLIPAPFFPEYTVFTESNGGKAVIIPHTGDSFDLDVNKIAKYITPKTKAIIINSPNNPSGAVYSEKALCDLAALLDAKSAEYGKRIYIISDEPYREIYYGNMPAYIPSIYRNTIICYSYSKSLALPGERIGYVAVYPKADDAEAVYLAVGGAARALGYVCAPSLMQRVIAKCANEKCDISLYRENADVLYSYLTKLGFECVKPEGAFYLMIKSPSGDGTEFSKRAKAIGILLVPGKSFGADEYVRLAYCVSRGTVNGSLSLFEKLKKSYE